MLATWIGIFAISLLAEVVTTCYYRALSADGPGRRRRAMLWSGACRTISLLLLRHVVAAEGAAGLIAATAFVAGDVVGTWLALWNEDRRAALAARIEPATESVTSPATLALIDAAVDARLDLAVRAAVHEEAERREAAVTQWRMPPAQRRAAGATFPRTLLHRAPQGE